MQKRLKMLVAVIMALSMVVTLLSGCGSSNTDNTASSTVANGTTQENLSSIKFDKPLEFTMLYSDMAVYPYKEDWLVWKKIKELTNVTLKPVVVPMADYVQKRSILISSGDAPQIMPKTYPGQEAQFIPSGAILPISDYADKLPNYSKRLKDWNMSADINTIKQRDGKYYVLPGLHEVFNQDYSIIYRADILKKNNIKVPTSYDELYTALKKLKEAYPSCYPMSEKQNMNALLTVAAPAFGARWGWNFDSQMMYDKSSDKFIYCPITDEYKSMLTYFAKLVKEGLLDPESVTQSDDMAHQKYVNSKSFMLAGNSQDLTINLQKPMDGILGAGKFELIKMPILTGPKGGNLVGTRLENGIMFASKVKDDPDFDKLMKFVDWLWYTEEGQLLTKWGVEGETYKVNNGKYELMPDVTFLTLNPKGTKDLRKEMGFGIGTFVYGGKKELVQSMMSQADLDFLSATFKQTKLLAVDPPVLMTSDEREQATMISKPLLDYMKQMTYKFMLGEANIDTDWDKFVAECKAKGCDKLQDMTNKVYNDTKDSLK